MSNGMNRRDFLKLSFAGFAAASMARMGIDLTTPQGRARAQSITATMPNGIASGDVTRTSAVLWTRSTVRGDVTFELATVDNFETVVRTATATVVEELLPVKVSVAGLEPATDYFYRATDAEGSMVMGYFRTSNTTDTRAGLRFGAAGDWRGELAPYPAVSNVPDRDLEFFIGLGDTIYADVKSPIIDRQQAETLEEFRLKHLEVYGPRFDQNTWADIRAMVPYIPTLDDHEVTNDFSGGAPAGSDPRFDVTGTFLNDTDLFRNGMQALFEYNPIENTTWTSDDPRMDGKPMVYRYFTYGSDAGLIILDNRSFRDAPLEEPADLTDLGAILGFLTSSVTEARTLLGEDQLQALFRDLQAAQDAGLTWKFVITAEPIQNLGPLASSDRFEGYAYERNRVLSFINDNNISNVVFISADIHGTVVNNLVYREAALGENIQTGAFDISTGSVAYYEPFGQTVINIGEEIGLIDQETVAAYRAGDNDTRETLMEGILNAQIAPLGYPQIGLDDAELIDAELLQGHWLQTSTFGWTEFEVDAETQVLTITTYGIEPYSPREAAEGTHLDRQPQILQQFVVRPTGMDA